MAGRIPFAGSVPPCIGREWYRIPGAGFPCPDTLKVSVLGGLGRVGLKFPGRNQVGPLTPLGVNCPGTTDAYVGICGSPSIYCAYVWDAYRDGIWTSSVAIEVYAMGTGSGRTIRAEINNDPTVFVDKTGINFTTNTCPGVSLQATITVNDDGTFSIA